VERESKNLERVNIWYWADMRVDRFVNLRLPHMLEFERGIKKNYFLLIVGFS
jgi:hypothetical protein